ncbi:hypothetical protein CLV24_101366 [Pontibacter ummariensis]|uniref:Uncharacterized protein n=1 Tax=Pontibacter ummariensis TaxID=1610492 RepID=A0A239BFD0_9BACT|nr:hypothetical protein [Pontibacter ummariensis]PRY16520.1 hypothetical protein CLV24_101366 [Pontibacter ummariensis]SNS06640.1 hypothetical protein SAMN06296052_101366 [Pontibacter ummariensis]
MPTAQESNIEDFAYDYLRAYYQKRQDIKTLTVDKAEKTKEGAVADGLFSFMNSDKSVLTASLHTRASKSIAMLLKRYKKRGLSKLRYVTGTLFMAGTVYMGLQLGHWLAFTLLPVLVAITTFLLHSLLEKRYLQNKITAMVDEVRKLPANEQWLGISISSLTFRQNGLAQHLLDTCQRRGIGVITVGKRAKVVLMQEPQAKVCRRGDFLSYYEAEPRIRKALQGDSFLRVA